MCFQCFVHGFFQGTLLAGHAAIADIRRFGKLRATFLCIKRAMDCAGTADRTFCPGYFMAGGTGLVLAAGKAEGAVIEGPSHCTGFFEQAVASDFFRDSSTVLAGFGGDGFETEAPVKSVLDLVSEFLCKMFVLVHGTSFPAGCRHGSGTV